MQKYYAPIILITGNFFFTISFSLAKLLTVSIPVETIMLFRFLAGPVYLAPYFLIKRKPLKVKSLKIFLLRVIFGVSAMSCLFLSFKYGQIGKSMLIFEFSTIWTLIYGYFIHKNKPHNYSIVAIPIAFIGIFLILQPGSEFNLGDFYALLGSVLNAGVYLTLKELRNNYDTTTIVLISYMLSSIIMLGPNVITFPSLTFHSFWILILMCSIGLIGQCMMTLGFKFATAGISSLLMLSIIPLTTISGILIFNETYSNIIWIGLSLVTGSLFVISKWQ